MSKKLRICFFGSPLFAVPSLDKLREAEHEILCVITQPPKPANRGKKIYKQPVQEYAEKNGMKIFSPESLYEEEFLIFLRSLKLEVIVVVAYGKIIPKSVLELPVLGCINLHASLLPRWRGAAPIQRAIMSGDDKTGVTVMLMDEGLDTGPILKSSEIKINMNDSYINLENRLATRGATLLNNTIIDFYNGKISPFSQKLKGVTYADKILKKDEIIDWSLDSFSIFKKIKSLSPYPGAKAKLKGEIIKILDAQIVPSDSNEESGTILSNDLCIKCGKESIKVLTVQRPGKKIMSCKDVLNGWPVTSGMKMEIGF